MSQPDITFIYRANTGLKDGWGLDSYRTPPYYEDPRRSIDSLKKKPTLKHKDKLHFKRETLFDELQKIAKKIPGPSQYCGQLVPTESVYKHQKSKSLPRLKGLTQLDRKDPISEIVKLKIKIPLVGKYNIVESIEQQQKKFEKYAQRRFKPTQPNIISGNYTSVSNVGPGAYNIHLKQFGKGTGIKISPEHRKRPKEEQIGFPSVHTYNPMPLYHNFEKSLQLEGQKDHKGKSAEGKVIIGLMQFSRAEKSPNPEAKHPRPSPASYALLTKWLPDKKDKDQKKRNIFKSVSKLSSRSIYYD